MNANTPKSFFLFFLNHVNKNTDSDFLETLKHSVIILLPTKTYDYLNT